MLTHYGQSAGRPHDRLYKHRMGLLRLQYAFGPEPVFSGRPLRATPLQPVMVCELFDCLSVRDRAV